ncbi:tyrosine protein kinase receptor torso [Leptinotarsa decemlineata]|uniref:tyrosine protein kinase receptor torso n=1 Tax=Leptinotarsa decemlineata TaxID=7539 RepID=UPI003D3092F2
MVQLKVLLVVFACFLCAIPGKVTNEVPPSERPSVCFGCPFVSEANQNTCRVPRCDICQNDEPRGANQEETAQIVPLLPPVEVHCKEADTIAVKWLASNDTFYKISYRDVQRRPSFVLETEPTRCGFANFTNLTPLTTYKIELRSFRKTKDGRIIRERSLPADIRTHRPSRIPAAVSSFYLKAFYLVEGTVTALVGWNKGEDNGCYFNVVSLGSEDEGYQDFNIENVWNNNEVNITQLKFGRNYSISIFGITDINSDFRTEGPKTWLNLTIPTCFQAYKYHKQTPKCAPEQPGNLTTKEISADSTDKEGSHLYNVILHWNEPEYKPEFYSVELILFNGNFTKFLLNVTGDSTTAKFKPLQLSPEYEVRMTAFSDYGRSATAVVHGFFNQSADSSIEKEPVIPTEVIFISVIPLTMVILFALFALNYYLGKREQQRERDTYFKYLEDKTSSNVTGTSIISIPHNTPDAWEMNTLKLKIEDILGHGEFGVVRRGWYLTDKGCYTQVAIKMLKDSPTREEQKQFHQEIEIMKSVPPHPQLVSLIGCVSRGQPMLVVEYCSKGDLQSYLRSAYRKVTKAILINNSIESSGSANYALNTLYDMNKDDLEDVPEPKDLISFARQVAIGMEYLASLKVIHRDLATRNILVFDNKTVKISDFGLSRDVYYNDIYFKSGGGKLPIRWMAPESMTRQIYTTQSDVWSFGILLWEIVTLGSTPYPGIATHDILGLLTSGNRMSKPEDCSEALYSIMTKCWKDEPSARPSFLEIRQSLDELLETHSDYLTLIQPLSDITNAINV